MEEQHLGTKNCTPNNNQVLGGVIPLHIWGGVIPLHIWGGVIPLHIWGGVIPLHIWGGVIPLHIWSIHFKVVHSQVVVAFPPGVAFQQLCPIASTVLNFKKKSLENSLTSQNIRRAK